MKPVIIAFFAILALVALIAGFTIMQTTSDASQVPLTICTDRDSYSLIMSSTVGIGLTPGYPTSVDNRTVIFLWQADYGHFLSWKAPDFKVNELGNVVYTDDGKIYWSYLSEDGKKAQAVGTCYADNDRQGFGRCPRQHQPGDRLGRPG